MDETPTPEVPLTTLLSLSPLAAAGGGESSGLGFDLVNLLVVLAAAWIAGRLAVRVGYPSVLGELAAGILLGPPLLGLLNGGDGLAVLGNLGIILMMLYIGMEVDLADLRKASGPGLLAATGGFLVPAVLGYVVVIAFGGDVLGALFVGISVGVTSLATKSRILVDLDLLDTRIAYVLMAGALISDTATLVAFAAIIGFVEAGGFDLAGTAVVAVEAVAFFAIAALVGLLVLPRIGRLWERRGLNDRLVGFAIVLSVGFGYAALAEVTGLHAILGAFVGGLFLRRDFLGERVTHRVEGMLKDISLGFLAPIFFVTAGFQISFDVFRTDLALLIAVVAVATFGKILGTALFYIPSGHGWREGLVVGFGMNGRGAVEIVVAGIGLELGLITQELFTILVFMAIATTATVPVMLTAGVRWLRGRGELARSEDRRKGVIVVGAGPVARLVARRLSATRPVWVVDASAERCELARADGLEAIVGDALDPEVLLQAHAAEAGVLLALTTNSEVNILAAEHAKTDLQVPHASVAVARSTDKGLMALLRRLEAVPLFEEPVDLQHWDQLVAAGRAGLVPATAAAGEEAGLPLLVARDGHHLLLVEVTSSDPDDVLLVLRRVHDDHFPGTPQPRAATPAPVVD